MGYDKNLFHYGVLYRRLLDPLILPARKQTPREARKSVVVDLRGLSARGC